MNESVRHWTRWTEIMGHLPGIYINLIMTLLLGNGQRLIRKPLFKQSNHTVCRVEQLSR